MARQTMLLGWLRSGVAPAHGVAALRSAADPPAPATPNKPAQSTHRPADAIAVKVVQAKRRRTTSKSTSSSSSSSGGGGGGAAHESKTPLSPPPTPQTLRVADAAARDGERHDADLDGRVADCGLGAAETLAPPDAVASTMPLDASASASTGEYDNDNDVDVDDRENDYESVRLRNIEANNRILAELGLLGARAAPAAPRPAVKRAWRPAAVAESASAAADALRRSSPRLQRARVDDSGAGGAATPVRRRQTDSDADDDAVSQLGQPIAAVDRHLVASAPPMDQSGRLYLSGHRHFVYSQSVTRDGTLLAVAGGDSRVSFYALPPLASLEGTTAPDVHAPLGSVKVHRRWIADVHWVEARPDTDGRLLLSASDDGTLLLSRCRFGASTDTEVAIVPVARLDAALHRAGLYSMDEVGGAIATSSKDGSVGVSALHLAAGLAVVRTYPDAGQGVVKHVRWQQRPVGDGDSAGAASDLFACGGNDGAVRIFDVRRADATPVVELAGSHATAVNTVAFAPAAMPWQLLSSGFDGVIRVWDVRAGSAQRPLAELVGHHGGHKPGLMHPIFYEDGRAILTAGHSAPYLFRYDVATGARSVVATLGWTPGTLTPHPLDPQRIFASVGKVGVWLLDGLVA